MSDPTIEPTGPTVDADPVPNPHATAEQIEAAWHDPKLANVLYHDWEAGTYDEKWSISYDKRCVDYAVGRFRAVAGSRGWPYPRAMELGSGTGFFLLNQMQAGVAEKGSVTDLSPGMVRVALHNAEMLGLPVDGRVADAERIPYDDDTFDLVVGHAVLHHIPDVPAALSDGYTTGNGLGLGLGGARRLVQEFSIDSAPGRGTTVTVVSWPRAGQRVSR